MAEKSAGVRRCRYGKCGNSLLYQVKIEIIDSWPLWGKNKQKQLPVQRDHGWLFRRALPPNAPQCSPMPPNARAWMTISADWFHAVVGFLLMCLNIVNSVSAPFNGVLHKVSGCSAERSNDAMDVYYTQASAHGTAGVRAAQFTIPCKPSCYVFIMTIIWADTLSFH